MPTMLVIGAGQGLGLEWVKHYKKRGYNVTATTRDIDRAKELRDLLNDGDKLLQMELTNPDSIQSALSQIKEAPDITIYNAGVKGYTKQPDTKATLLNAQLDSTPLSRRAGRELAFQVNANGFDEVMSLLQDKLLAKPNTTVVYISTGVANTAQNTSGGYPFYRESKIAGEAYARAWYIDLLSPSNLKTSPRVFSLAPGLVNTGMGAGIDNAADPAERVAQMAKVINHVAVTGNTHGVWKYDGSMQEQYELPDLLKKTREDKKSVTPILANQGLYRRRKSSSDKSIQANLVPELTEKFNINVIAAVLLRHIHIAHPKDVEEFCKFMLPSLSLEGIKLPMLLAVLRPWILQQYPKFAEYLEPVASNSPPYVLQRVRENLYAHTEIPISQLSEQAVEELSKVMQSFTIYDTPEEAEAASKKILNPTTTVTQTM